VASYSLFVPERYALGVDTPRAALGLVVFVFVGILIRWLCELLHLVELHGGCIAAHSAGIGRGSELSVRLPVPAAT
jgi:hypothetical protein